MKKSVFVCVIALLVCVVSCFGVNPNQQVARVFASTEVSVQKESYAIAEVADEKVFCNATLGDNFTDDMVLVALTKDVTFEHRKNSIEIKNYTIKDFPELQLDSVEEITEETVRKVKQQTEEKLTEDELQNQRMRIDPDKFRRILRLILAEKSKENVLDAIKLLEERKDVLSASPNYIGEYNRVPNATHYQQGRQWAVDTINLPKAWDITIGSATVKVGIVDSGIDRVHLDLRDRIDQGLSADFSGGNNPWFTTNNHGTHVAGIIGANRNSGTPGIIGANWNVTLVSLKVGNAAPTTNAVTAAIVHATNNNIDILNLSLSVSESNNMNIAINTYPGLLVCAAGNDGNTSVSYPARLAHNRIISVGSTTQADAMSSFSNRSATAVDVFAPGGVGTPANQTGNIYSTLQNNTYGYNVGTSFAAPMVAGVAALLLSAKPLLTAAQLKNAIMEGVEPIDSLTTRCVSGGRLDAYGALQAGLGIFNTGIYQTVADGTELNLYGNNASFTVTISNGSSTRSFSFVGQGTRTVVSSSNWLALNGTYVFNTVKISFTAHSLTVVAPGAINEYLFNGLFISTRITTVITKVGIGTISGNPVNTNLLQTPINGGITGNFLSSKTTYFTYNLSNMSGYVAGNKFMEIRIQSGLLWDMHYPVIQQNGTGYTQIWAGSMSSSSVAYNYNGGTLTLRVIASALNVVVFTMSSIVIP